MPLSNNLDSNSSVYGFKNMPRPQKTAVIILSILGIAIIFSGAWQLRNRIVGPFNLKDSQLSNEKNPLSSLDLDTDKDGISDYDEANIYKTSRYLEDTDSDGLSDKAEIDAGTNPNCPIGQNCLGETEFSASGNASNTATLIDNTATGTINVSDKTNPADLQNALSGQIDAATLRKILIEGGADKASLDLISDADLLKSYQEVLNKQNE